MSRDVFENNLIAKLGDEGYRKVRGAKVGIAEPAVLIKLRDRFGEVGVPQFRDRRF